MESSLTDINNSCNDAQDSSDFSSYFAESVENARKRQFTAALKCLEAAVQTRQCSTVEALDLQARIFAQQGRYLDSEAAWTRILKLDPGNVAAQQGLHRLRRERAPLWRLKRIFLACAAFCIVLILIAYAFLLKNELITTREADAKLAYDLDARITAAESRLSDTLLAHERLLTQFSNTTKNITTLQTQKLDEIHTQLAKTDQNITTIQTGMVKIKNILDDTMIVSIQQAKQTQNLEDLLGELHDAVNILQTEQTSIAMNAKERDVKNQTNISRNAMTVSQLTESLKSLESHLEKQIDSSNSNISKKITDSIVDIKSRIDKLPSTTLFTSLDVQVKQLKEQLVSVKNDLADIKQNHAKVIPTETQFVKPAKQNDNQIDRQENASVVDP